MNNIINDKNDVTTFSGSAIWKRPEGVLAPPPEGSPSPLWEESPETAALAEAVPKEQHGIQCQCHVCHPAPVKRRLEVVRSKDSSQLLDVFKRSDGYAELVIRRAGYIVQAGITVRTADLVWALK